MATFYIDGTNGTNSYTGLKITGTIDSSADSTHFVDSALTGADDYINGSFFFNITTGAGTLIADFVAATDTVTLTDADGSMAAGDTYSILHALLDIDQFASNARSAGDICIVRRGTEIGNGTDVGVTSDGTKPAPITIKADNANEWKDDVDLSGTATATPTFGSKVVLFSADITGVIATKDVIYVAAEAADDFAYEVALAQVSDSGTDDGADSNRLIDTGKFSSTVIGTEVVNTTDSITGYVSRLIGANEVEVTVDGRPSSTGSTIVVFDNGDTFTIANQAVLFLPYKGAQAGSGKTMTNMQGNPVWNSALAAIQWNFDGDFMWKLQGLELGGTDTNGIIELDGCTGHVFKDCVFIADGTVNHRAIFVTDDTSFYQAIKCRTFDIYQALQHNSGASAHVGSWKDSLFDGNGINNSTLSFGTLNADLRFEECESRGYEDEISYANTKGAARAIVRNMVFGASIAANPGDEVTTDNATGFSHVSLEDYDGSLGDSQQFTPYGVSDPTVTIQSDTGTIRSGGGAISGKYTPSTALTPDWEIGRQLLFEIGFYATTSSKKYEVFFRPTATTDFTADPTATELWIELEAWGHATFNKRKVTKSTGVIDMNGSTTFTALDVTVAPAQAGVAYLRGYYAKTKESGKANTFFWDVVPVVT